MKNPYEVLGISSHATREQIGTAFKNLARMYHPDLGNSNPEMMVAVTQAYAVLKDEDKRAQFDAEQRLIGMAAKPRNQILYDNVCLPCNGQGRVRVQQGFYRATMEECDVCGGTGKHAEALESCIGIHS